MDTDIEYQQGSVSSHKETSEGHVPRSTGLHTRRFEFSQQFPYPIVVENVTSYYSHATKNHEADVEIVETVPQISRFRNLDDECQIRVVCSYILKGGTRDTSSRRNAPDLKIEHQVLFRNADDVSLTVTG